MRTANPAFRLFWKRLWAVQCQQRYRDTAPRGHGNRAARRVAQTAAFRQHLRWSDEPVYSPDSPKARLLDRTLRLVTLRPIGNPVPKPLPPYL